MGLPIVDEFAKSCHSGPACSCGINCNRSSDKLESIDMAGFSDSSENDGKQSFSTFYGIIIVDSSYLSEHDLSMRLGKTNHVTSHSQGLNPG